jgi:hypothetical protein
LPLLFVFVFAFLLSSFAEGGGPAFALVLAFRLPRLRITQPCSPNKKTRHFDRSKTKWRNPLLYAAPPTFIERKQKKSSPPSSSSPL